LTVSAIVLPTGDLASFNLQIDGVTYNANVRGSGSTGPQTVNGGPHNVALTAGSGTNFANYSVVIAGDCDASGNINLAAGDRKTCTVSVFGPEAVQCFVFDDGYTNMEGPSDAIYISGRTRDNGMACIPSGQFGKCHKWFGRCYAVNTGNPVFFTAFDDGVTNRTAPSDAVFISPSDSKACVPDASTGTCRKWFGLGSASEGRPLVCNLFDDGGSNLTPATEISIPSPIPTAGAACGPGACRRWFGACQVK
jgi:hypothetical protein